MLSLIHVSELHRHAESARFLIDQTGRSPVESVEAMKLLYELAFETLQLDRVFGFVVSGNGPMLKWQKYFGMKEEGRLRQHYRFQNETHDAVCVGILKEEYRTIALIAK